MRAASIYIHWPFCLSLCPYCDFNSHLLQEIDNADWLADYKNELNYFADRIKGRRIASIFFGGGTPSLMPVELVDGIIDHIAVLGGIDESTEITLEANPTSYEASKFRNFRSAGVNRVSIGVQSFCDEELKFLGRKHDSDTARAAIESAHQIFPRYSFDLIYALHGQNLAKWEKQLRDAMSIANGHISLYQLTIEKGTPFFKQYNEGKLLLPDQDLAADMYYFTNQYLTELGYYRYEISNYAYESSECVHNLCYWNYHEYIGIGAGAHSRLHQDGRGIEAIMMYHKPQSWRDNVAKHGVAIQSRTMLTCLESVEEKMMMGLRLAIGVDVEDVLAIAQVSDISDVLNMEVLNDLSKRRMIILKDGRLRLTDEGLALHSYIVPRILKETISGGKND